MIKQLEQVAEFHKIFDIYTAPKPSIPDLPIRELRNNLHYEEFKEVQDELLPVLNWWNIDKVAKELADLIYVTYGTVLAYGLQDKFEAVFDEVHRSNMSKLDENGKVLRRQDGKVLKSNLYKPANIEEILNKSSRGDSCGVLV